MFEKEAEEYADKQIGCGDGYYEWTDVENAFKDGAEFGYNKAMKEWRDCFMSCSSPYCADKFKDVRCEGMLGNMTKGASYI